MDKQDELAAVVCRARLGVALPSSADIEPSDDDLRVAAAVRSFMGSPEVINRAERAAAEAGGVDIGSLDVPVVQMTRAALSAAIGGDAE